MPAPLDPPRASIPATDCAASADDPAHRASEVAAVRRPRGASWPHQLVGRATHPGDQPRALGSV
jgi:hypothetical protein